MILDVDRKVLLSGLQRDAFRHRPAGKRTVTLEPEVVVQVPRVMALDHEDRFLALASLAKRLGRLPPRPLALVVLQRGHAHPRLLTVVSEARISGNNPRRDDERAHRLLHERVS